MVWPHHTNTTLFKKSCGVGVGVVYVVWCGCGVGVVLVWCRCGLGEGCQLCATVLLISSYALSLSRDRGFMA